MDITNDSSSRLTPTRKACEDIIRRILITEVLETGGNHHFKKSSDFLSYFESLYPASAALTKQVQRAVKSMDMPKDASGYYIIGKTSDQMEEDNEMKDLLFKSGATLVPTGSCETLLLRTGNKERSYLLSLFESSSTFEDKFFTAIETCNGILFFTDNASKLESVLKQFLAD